MKKQIRQLLSTLSPKLATCLMYYGCFHKFPDLKNPQNINEKIQYLKLNTYNHNPVITQCVDKLRVKKYLYDRDLESIVPQMLGSYCLPEEVRRHWNEYPQKFVIKCNHGSGYNVLVTNKDTADIDEIIARLRRWMKEDFWRNYCELQYKCVEKAILVEEYLGDDILHYKFFCFHGMPRFLYVSDGVKDEFVEYYDMDWNKLPLTLKGYEYRDETVEKPQTFDEMVAISKKLSKDFPFVRVDLYDAGGRVYFSELTFVPTGGMMQIHPPEVLNEWGKMLNLGGVFPKNT